MFWRPTFRLPWRLDASGLGLLGALLCVVGLGAGRAIEGGNVPPATLPASPELEAWYARAREIERGLRLGEPAYTLELKKSHVYAKVLRHGEVVGRFRPETSSTSVQGEISTFNIGRALGCGELFQPAVEMRLRGKGLTTFRKMMEAARFTEEKEDERQALLWAMEASPKVLLGAFKPMVPGEAVKYTGLERIEEMPNGGLETNDPIARYLRHDAPQPGFELIGLPLTRLHVSPRKLSRELSNILLVDALAGQWDRFSGHNLHILSTKEGAQLMAIDNGGANLMDDQGYLERFTHWVTRFDPPVAERLLEMDNFFRKHGHFREFTSEKELGKALAIEDADEWAAFQKRVHRLATHIRISRTGGWFER